MELRDSASGQLAGRGKAPHPSVTPPVSEQDPRAWLEAFHGAFEMALHDASLRSGLHLAKGSVVAISVAAQQHGMVVLGPEGTVLRPAKLWNDTEPAPDAAHLRKLLAGGDTAWVEACGSVPVAALTISKLAWLRRCEPEIVRNIAKILLPHDWITYQLTGMPVTDRGDASGTGYWSPAEGRWRPDLLALVDPDLDWEPLLPRVLGPTEPAGTWGAVVVGPGTGDNMASALGIGLKPGDVAISLGTSGTVFMVSDEPTADVSGQVDGFADASGRFLPLVCTLNATLVTDTMTRLLGLDREQFAQMALDEPAGAHGVVLVPYLAGERTPDRPYARGGLAGLQVGATPASLARAAVEGVVCSMLDAVDHLRAVAGRRQDRSQAPAEADGQGGDPLGDGRGGASPTPGGSERAGRLFLVGGGARSIAYRQILADLAGTEVIVPRGEESVATGACVQAAAVARGCSVDHVMGAWGLDRGSVAAPREIAQRAEVRARYTVIAANELWDSEPKEVLK